MAEDVAPKILEELQKRIGENTAEKRRETRLIVKAEKGEATFRDAQEYAGLRGEDVGNAVRGISSSTLPNGEMYYNIASRTIQPVLEELSEDVLQIAADAVKTANERAGIGIAPQVPDMSEKIHGIVDACTNREWEEAREEVATACETFSRKCVDDTVKENARFQAEAGMDPKVIRTAAAGACTWCADIAGTYEYNETQRSGSDVWRRHAHCDCVVEFEPVKGRRELVSSSTHHQNLETLTPQEREQHAEELRLQKNARDRERYHRNKGGVSNLTPEERERRAEKQVRVDSEKDILKTGYSNKIQLSALDAPGFQEKFNKITRYESVNSEIYRSSVEILKHRNGTDFEDLYLLDAEKGNLIYALTTSDLKNQVKYDNGINMAIQKAHEEGRTIIAIHNHPNGTPPSLDDGVSALLHGYDSGVVVGHNLEVFTYGRTAYEISEEICQEVHNKLSRVLMFDVDFEEKVWYDALRAYGMEVKRL